MAAMPNDPIIDAHQHPVHPAWDPSPLLLFMERASIDACWLLGSEAIDGGLEPGYRAITAESILKFAELHPGRFVPFAAVDPRRDNAVARLHDLHARGARGYGEIKLRACYDAPEFLAMYRVAGELGMPVVMHLQYGPPAGQWFGGSIDAVERAVSACPDTTFIAHAQSFWSHISGDGQGEAGRLNPTGPVAPGGAAVRMLQAHPNLHADLAAGSGYGAITRDREFGRQFLIDFADKLLFGSDFLDVKYLQLLCDLDLPEEVFAKITSRNARRLIP